jgi:hypothetical protein
VTAQSFGRLGGWPGQLLCDWCSAGRLPGRDLWRGPLSPPSSALWARSSPSSARRDSTRIRASGLELSCLRSPAARERKRPSVRGKRSKRDRRLSPTLTALTTHSALHPWAAGGARGGETSRGLEVDHGQTPSSQPPSSLVSPGSRDVAPKNRMLFFLPQAGRVSPDHFGEDALRHGIGRAAEEVTDRRSAVVPELSPIRAGDAPPTAG